MNSKQSDAGAGTPAFRPALETAGWYGIPRLPRQYVRRPRLLALLDGAATCLLVLVSAPAGSGKTSLVADWVSDNGEQDRTEWITFEAEDEAFWPGLIGCLERLGVAVSHQAFPRTAVTLDRRLLASVAAAVASQPSRLTVVVDGYDVVSAEVADDVEFLLSHSGHRLRLVVVTRVDPVLPLYRYRLEDTIAEVRMAHLAFTDDEAARLLEDCGVVLTPASVRVLNARTQGWAVGLRFAARMLVRREDPDRAVADVSGDIGNIGEYLLGEVLAAQTPQVREFLLSTSIPDTLQPGLAEELGGHSAARTLAFLTRVNAFIEPVPEHPGYYRYHPFFRDLLRSELAYESPELMAQLQLRAAKWFAHEGLLTASVGHYAALGAWIEAATQLVDDLAVGELLLGGGSSVLARALRAIPDDLKDASTSVVRATLSLADGDTHVAGEQLTQAQQSLEGSESAHVGAVSLCVAVLQALRACFTDDPTGALALAESAERALDEFEDRPKVDSHPELCAMVRLSRGIATTRRGQLADANDVFGAAAAVATSAGAGAEPLLVESLGWLAVVGCLRGQLTRAESLATRAVDIADSVALPPAVRPSPARVALAWVCVERYDLRAGLEHLRLVDEAEPVHGDPVTGTLLALARARLQVARGDLSGALASVEGALVDTSDPNSWLADTLRIEAGHLRVTNGEPAVALLEVEGVWDHDRAEVALVVAQARLAQGDVQAAGEALSQVLVGGAASMTQISGWLVEVSRQLLAGSPRRARSALERSLRLASRESLRRPFREAPTAVRELLAHDAQLVKDHAWLSSDSRRYARGGLAAASVPGPRSARELVVAPVVESLTPKELEVLGHLAELLTTEEIASTMFVSVNTVRTHVRSILRKLGVSRRNAAVRRARDLHLLPS